MLAGFLLRAASRLLAISVTIVLVAPMPHLSSLIIHATIASSSSLLRFFKLGSQLRHASVPLRHSLGVVQGTSNAFNACLVLSGRAACVPLIVWYSVPSL